MTALVAANLYKTSVLLGFGNFKHGTKWFLVRCPKCSKENWAPAVASGKCAWCPYDVNRGAPYGT